MDRPVIWLRGVLRPSKRAAQPFERGRLWTEAPSFVSVLDASRRTSGSRRITASAPTCAPRGNGLEIGGAGDGFDLRVTDSNNMGLLRRRPCPRTKHQRTEQRERDRTTESADRRPFGRLHRTVRGLWCQGASAPCPSLRRLGDNKELKLLGTLLSRPLVCTHLRLLQSPGAAAEPCSLARGGWSWCTGPSSVVGSRHRRTFLHERHAEAGLGRRGNCPSRTSSKNRLMLRAVDVADGSPTRPMGRRSPPAARPPADRCGGGSAGGSGRR